MFRKYIVLSLVAVASVLVLAGCQQAAVPQPAPKAGEKPAAEKAVATTTKAAEKPVRGRTLRIVRAGLDFASQEPHASNGPSVIWLAHDALIWHDQDLNVTKEGLARDWAISPDGKTMTLKLREGVKFHDGTDFDAAAVKFNIERVQDPALKSPYRSDYAAVASVEVVDGLTTRLNLTAPDPLLLPKMGTNSGAMVSPAAVKKYGQDFGRHPVGTGPFQFVDWVPDERVSFKRFEGYWRKDQEGNQLPYLEQVVEQMVPDDTVAFANFRSGQADVFGNTTAEQLALLKGDPNLTYTALKYSVIYGVYLNTVRPPFDNKALRQAVALAVDRQGIAARLGEGGSAEASVLHPMTWAYDGKAGVFPGRDLAKAKAKMSEAGYAGGLKVKMPTGVTAAEQLHAQIVKANLAEIGLEAEIEVLGGAAFITRVRLEQNYGMTAPNASGLWLADPGHLLGQNFHSRGSRNYYGPYSNLQVDQLLGKAGSIYDQKERAALYREAATIIADDVPLLSLYVPNNINGLSKKVRNYLQYPDNRPRTREVWLAP